MGKKSSLEKYKDAWEIHYSPPIKNTKNTVGAEFNPMRAYERMKTYSKMNEFYH